MLRAHTGFETRMTKPGSRAACSVIRLTRRQAFNLPLPMAWDLGCIPSRARSAPAYQPCSQVGRGPSHMMSGFCQCLHTNVRRPCLLMVLPHRHHPCVRLSLHKLHSHVGSHTWAGPSAPPNSTGPFPSSLPPSSQKE